MTRLRVRHEVRPGEARTALVPADAAALVRAGVGVTVETSAQRAFPITEYAAAGCAVAPAGSWVDAAEDEIVLGVKELPGDPPALRARHVYFGHAFKGQAGAAALLRRFHDGGGTLLDLEYLTDDDGRRVAAFGYWAGWVGAALAVLHARGALPVPLVPTTADALRRALAAGTRHGVAESSGRAARPVESSSRVRGNGAGQLSVLVTGALGRCGRGARDALDAAGIVPTCWDVAETAALDRDALLAHDVLVHCVGTDRPAPPLLRRRDLDRPDPDRPDPDRPDRRLRVVADVTCDIGSDCSLLPLHDRTTTWSEPVLTLTPSAGPPVDVIAVDNLPSLVPVEASTGFSADLVDHLTDPDRGAVWARSRAAYDRARRALIEGAPL